jgi:hypothetical protein
VILLLKERDNLHATLELVDQDKRSKNALRILDLSDEIGSIYERLEHFNIHGVLPAGKSVEEKKKPQDMDVGELIRLQLNLRSYISRYARLEKNAKTIAAAARNRDIRERYELQLAQVDQMLNR